MASSNIILILLYLSPFYRTYYKATIKTFTSVKRGYYKARHSRLSDINDHFRQVTKKVSKNRRFPPPASTRGEVIGGYYYSIIFAMSHSVDWTTFNSNGLPTADGSVSRQNVGTVFYKKILPKIFLIWGNIKPIYDDNSIKLPFSSAMSDYSQVFTLYGAGMNSTKGFIAPGASSIGFTKQTTGNTYALWGIAALNG